MEKECKTEVLKTAWKKFIAISPEGEFHFSRGLFREEGLDPSTHCYLAYSASHRAVLFCFTRSRLASGALPVYHRKPRGSLLKAREFFQHFELCPRAHQGLYPVKKAQIDGVQWHAIFLKN